MVKKGQLILTTYGEYSDYAPVQLVRALKNFDPESVAKEFIAKHKVDTEPYAKSDKFEAWLVAEGLVEEVDCFEWHIGTYGDFEPSFKGDLTCS